MFFLNYQPASAFRFFRFVDHRQSLVRSRPVPRAALTPYDKQAQVAPSIPLVFLDERDAASFQNLFEYLRIGNLERFLQESMLPVA